MGDVVKPKDGLPVLSVVEDSAAKDRLDTFLVRRLTELLAAEEVSDEPALQALGEHALSRSKVRGWIDAGHVTVDGVPATKGGMRLDEGARIELAVPPPPAREVQPDSTVPFRIVFEDDSLLVVDKPAGVVVHPGAGVDEGTLLAGVLAHLEQQGAGTLAAGSAPHRPGIVHRLDRDTSGLLVIAKSDRSYHGLVAQLQPPRKMSRTYLLLTSTVPKRGKGSTVDETGLSGTIELPIGRDPRTRVKMAVVEEGKGASTSWTVDELLRLGMLVRAELGTGRTHQIRVHFLATGAPVLGDPLYTDPVRPLPPELRGAAKRLGRQALHAWRLAFDHPVSGERMSFEAPLPPDMQELLDKMR